MLRAILWFACGEAARRGTYRASFHGFYVHARRHDQRLGSEDKVEVSLRVSLGHCVVAQGVALAAVDGTMEPTGSARVS
jgi:hypothetical protein